MMGIRREDVEISGSGNGEWSVAGLGSAKSAYTLAYERRMRKLDDMAAQMKLSEPPRGSIASALPGIFGGALQEMLGANDGQQRQFLSDQRQGRPFGNKATWAQQQANFQMSQMYADVIFGGHGENPAHKRWRDAGRPSISENRRLRRQAFMQADIDYPPLVIPARSEIHRRWIREGRSVRPWYWMICPWWWFKKASVW